MGIFKKVGGRLVDVRVDKWMSWDYLGDTANRFKVLLLDIVIPKKATYSETFEEAMQRLGLTEDDVEQRKKEFVRLIAFFIVLALAIVSYALYLAFQGSLAPSLIAFCLALYSLSQAFRFHFWLFQLRHRKLGCTIKEWMNAKIIQEPSRDIVKKETTVMKSKGRRQQKAKE